MSSPDRQAIERVYGPHPDLYQILNISQTASSTQIREAYFCLRYDIYQQLSNEAINVNGSGGSTLSEKERKEIEAKMDAVTGAFRILTDPGKRIQYDSSMMDNESTGDGPNVDGRDKRDDGGNDDEPPEAKRTVNSRIHRSVFRRRGNAASTKTPPSDEKLPPTTRSAAAGGMQYVRSRAETVRGFRKKNLDRSKSRDDEDGHDVDELEDDESFDSEVEEATRKKETAPNKYAKPAVKNSIVAQRKQRQLRNRSSSSKENHDEEVTSATVNHLDDVSTGLNTSTTSTVGMMYQEHLPVAVDNLNFREQMLYKNQMYMNSTANNTAANARGSKAPARDNIMVGRSRIASRYQAEERRDWLVTEDGAMVDDDPANDDDRENRMDRKTGSSHRIDKVASPTGVEEFQSIRMHDNVKKDSSANKKVDSSRTKSKSAASTSFDKPSRFSFDDETTHSQDDDDTRTFDDASTTYDDDTTNFDDTTVGDTLDETTLEESVVSYDDETYSSDMKKHSPGHKKGNRPEPILRGGEKYTSRGGKDVGDNRRVTIHSHRGRKGRSDDKDFADSMCPFPSITDIKEEVHGTYKDATSAFHQVLHAFVISPDDIDRMSDKIRDAKDELTENYQRQLKERKKVGKGNVGRELKL
ncbi:hypothetical protein HJC23_007470 [Cyclotella cryptica]|uniref:J domain-containing protein n=1 Tax=Cyclotella cryptica TaxID=29204 RepID=A0ABD3NR86_9STRA|eukprot:CCRYP_020093-RA/>CCRYP_020093-RA protein AED:0.17 eAED:0.17 QI:0/-1/0/1/-1/1/1/0/639